jgi:hypothetical protein
MKQWVPWLAAGVVAALRFANHGTQPIFHA